LRSAPTRSQKLRQISALDQLAPVVEAKSRPLTRPTLDHHASAQRRHWSELQRQKRAGLRSGHQAQKHKSQRSLAFV
jgi:hypothetical protein